MGQGKGGGEGERNTRKVHGASYDSGGFRDPPDGGQQMLGRQRRLTFDPVIDGIETATTIISKTFQPELKK